VSTTIINIAPEAAIVPLTPDEQTTLRECETDITENLQSFVTIGLRLQQIRDQRLYRETHESFEAYCREKLDIGRSHGNHLIRASEAAVTLQGTGSTLLPLTETQIRPITQFPPEHQPAVWEDVIKRLPTKPDGTPILTASQIEKIVKVQIAWSDDEPYRQRRREMNRAKREARQERREQHERERERLASQRTGHDAGDRAQDHDDRPSLACPECGRAEFDDYGDCCKCRRAGARDEAIAKLIGTTVQDMDRAAAIDKAHPDLADQILRGEMTPDQAEAEIADEAAPAPPLKHTETYQVSDAMAFATVSISQLERISDDDPKRDDALVKVATWISGKRREWDRETRKGAAFDVVVGRARIENAIFAELATWPAEGKHEAADLLEQIARELRR
jgi:hypothetical protein